MAFAPVVRGANKLEVKFPKAESEAAEIVLIGAIGKSWWDDTGITETEVRDALKTIPAGRKINVRINSEGGSVKEGLGIYNAFKERRDSITAHITGYALSIASIFPLGAGRVVSPKSAIWMMHKAWSWNQGNADDMRQAADMLDAHDETLADIYAAETGKPKAEILAAMEKETWIKGADAVAYGLADETDPEETGDTSQASHPSYRPLAQEFLSRCKNISPDILNALAPRNGPGAPIPTAAPQPAGNHTNPTPQNTMNKKTIVALLLAHGITNATTGKAFLETDADADFETGLNTLATKKAQTDSSAQNLTDLAGIRAELTALKKARIEDRLNAAVDDQKITKAEAKFFLTQALTSAAAETEVFALLAEKESAAIGGEAAGFHTLEVMDGPNLSAHGVQGSKVLPELDNIFKATKDITGIVGAGTVEAAPAQALARYNAMKAEFPRLLKAAFRKDNGVQASNTFSGTITTNLLIQAVITKLYGRFAPAALFTRDNAQDPYKPLALGIQKFNTTSTDGSQVGTDVTNFETLTGGSAGSIDSTIDAITITPHQYTAGGYINNAQLNSGFRVSDLLEAKMAGLAAKVTQVLTAPITVANFTTNAPLIRAAALFGFSDLATLQGQLKKTLKKNLLLDGEYQARIANTPGFFQTAGITGGMRNAWQAFGWDNIALNTDWSGAGANVRGFGCGENCIGIISGLPLNPPEGIPGNIVQTGVAMIPDVEIGIATYAWFSPTARSFFFTYDLILGATLIDELQGVLIKDA